MCLSMTPAYAQQATKEDLKIVVQRQHDLVQQSEGWLEGYAEAVAGTTMAYHNLREDCMNALITRTTDGAMDIVWKTATVPADYTGEDVTFFFLTGMDLRPDGHAFKLYVNDELRFVHTSSNQTDWTLDGQNGGTLAFNSFLIDVHQDAMGYMRMTVPASWLTKGEPATLRMVGDADDSPTWFMIFQCPDAFGHFRQKAGYEFWMDMQVVDRGKKQEISVRGPAFWAGQTLAIQIGEQKSVSETFEADGENAVARLRIRGRQDAIAGQPLTVTLNGQMLLTVPEMLAEEMPTTLNPKGYVAMQGHTPQEDVWQLEAQGFYQPTLTQGLRHLSNSRLSQGEVHILNSSHQDIAWMDSPEQCIIDRDVLLITPALQQLAENPDYGHDMENSLMLMEYLDRHPDRFEEIAEYTRNGRITWGAAYNSPYEEMYSGEGLVRQFYLGKKWLEKLFPGAKANTYWNVDVPGRSLQMPQILHKAGVKYMMISRHDEGIFRWLSPDGTGVPTYSSGHYGHSINYLKKGFVSSASHIANQAQVWTGEAYNTRSTAPPVMPILSSEDMSPPKMYYDLIQTWDALAAYRDEDGTPVPLTLPRIKHSTGEVFMDAMMEASPDVPTLMGERPNVWVYIHGSSHQHALAAGRAAGIVLPAAEKFASINTLLDGNWDRYPQEKFLRAWRAAIYPDHGWGGKNGDITDQTFLDSLSNARDLGEEILTDATRSIAEKVQVKESAGIPVVIFNSLSWHRSDPVIVEATFEPDELRGFEVRDDTGQQVPFQVMDMESYDDGTVKQATVVFVARDVPPIGYATYYFQRADASLEVATQQSDPGEELDNAFYQITLGRGGLRQIHDKELGQDLIDADKFLAGELFTMKSVGNGAGEFADVQQPSMEGFDRLSNHQPVWEVVEAGPVRTVLRAEQAIEHTHVEQKMVLYHTIKRIDFETSLLEWDGTVYREFRLAFPANMAQGQVTYEVPFGVVRVGKDEIPQAAGERYTTPAAEVRPRGIDNWIGVSNDRFGLTMTSSVAAWDFQDPTDDPLSSPVLQPILLASRHSCHWEGLPYTQEGDHHFHFSLTSHAPGWENGYRFGRQTNEPLRAVFRPVARQAELPASLSFFSTDADNLLISTIKKSEDNDALILRIYDTEGKDTEAKVRTFFRLNSAAHTNIIEEHMQPISASEDGVSIQVGHHAIETYRLEF